MLEVSLLDLSPRKACFVARVPVDRRVGCHAGGALLERRAQVQVPQLILSALRRVGARGEGRPSPPEEPWFPLFPAFLSSPSWLRPLLPPPPDPAVSVRRRSRGSTGALPGAEAHWKWRYKVKWRCCNILVNKVNTIIWQQDRIKLWAG